MGDKKYPCSYVKEESVLLKYDIIYIVILDNIKREYKTHWWNIAAETDNIDLTFWLTMYKIIHYLGYYYLKIDIEYVSFNLTWN